MPKKLKKYSTLVGSMIATAVPGSRPALDEAGGNGARGLIEFRVRDDALAALLVLQHDVRAVGVAAHVPREHFVERDRLVRRLRLRRERGHALERGGVRVMGGLAASSARSRSRGVSALGHDGFGQAHAEAPLEAQEQLDAAEAVEAVVLLEPGVERGGNGGAGGVQLGGELPQQSRSARRR